MEVAKYIVSVLEELDVENELIRIDKNIDLGLFKIPVGWNIYDAELWLVKPRQQRLLKLDDHPTMVLAHSPATNGWLEGELISIGRGTRPEDYNGKNVEGKFVLAYGQPYYVYKEASKHGALGIIYYRRGAPDEAVPYAGLFLTLDEAREAKTIGLSISNRIARQLLRYLEEKEKVVLRVRIATEYDFNPILPVVIARYAGEKREGYALIAHMCHPKPGAHDNGSGVAALLEAATILSKTIEDDGSLPSIYYSIYFMWVPEYLGTQGLLSIKSELLQNIRAVINLDMVGAKPEVTESSLHHINSSITVPSYLDALLDKAIHIMLTSPSTYSSLTRSPIIKYDRAVYEGGSDHDVFISYGIPASMLNQWPDKFYHTDMDDIENIDPILLTKISVAALGSVYFVSSISGKDSNRIEYLLYALTDYYNVLISERLLRASEKELGIREEIEGTLRLYLSQAFDSVGEHFGYEKAAYFKERFIKESIKREHNRLNGLRPHKLFKGLLSTRSLYDEYKDKIMELLELVEKKNKYATVLFREALNLADGKRSIEEIYHVLIAEYGIDAVEREDLEKFFKILESMKLIELK